MLSSTPMKRGAEKSFSHAEGGGGAQQVLEVVPQELEVLAMALWHSEWGGGGCKKFPPFRRGMGGGAQQVLPCLEGGGTQFRTRHFPIL